VLKNFDSFALILICWLDKPEIILAMLGRNMFSHKILFADFVEALNKRLVLRVLQTRTEYKSGSHCMKYIIL